jgi:hypothetical protein
MNNHVIAYYQNKLRIFAQYIGSNSMTAERVENYIIFYNSTMTMLRREIGWFGYEIHDTF